MLIKTPILYHQCSFVRNSLNVHLDTRGITVIPLVSKRTFKASFFVVPPPNILSPDINSSPITESSKAETPFLRLGPPILANLATYKIVIWVDFTDILKIQEVLLTCNLRYAQKVFISRAYLIHTISCYRYVADVDK